MKIEKIRSMHVVVTESGEKLRGFRTKRDANKLIDHIEQWQGFGLTNQQHVENFGRMYPDLY